jgi:hypothetical protein
MCATMNSVYNQRDKNFETKGTVVIRRDVLINDKISELQAETVCMCVYCTCFNNTDLN